MATVEQTIMTAAGTALGNISIANGYSFDVGSNVFEWRDSPLDDTEIPAIIYRDPSNEVSAEDEKEHILIIETDLLDVGDSSPSSVRQKVQDIITALSALETNSAVAGCSFVRAEKDIERAERRAFAARLTFEVYYYAEPWII